MKIFGIIGWPVAHSLSPKIQNEFFKNEQLDWNYQLMPVKPEDLKNFMSDFKDKRVAGANVTAPHKHQIIQYLDGISERARAVDAVNTLYWKSNKLLGDNTDIQGFLDDLRAKNIDWTGKSVLILGAGGASRAVQYALKEAGAGKITIWSRGSRVGPGMTTNTSLIINCTPGLSKEYLEQLEFQPGQIVYDLVYNPPLTPIMKRAKDAGAKVFNGLGMLECQAALSFEIWKESYQK